MSAETVLDFIYIRPSCCTKLGKYVPFEGGYYDAHSGSSDHISITSSLPETLILL